MQILQDIATAVRLTGEVRRARKHGTEVEVRTIRRTPAYEPSFWSNTIESTLIHGEQEAAVRAVFYSLNKEMQHSLAFAPVIGGWIGRAQFWQRELKPTLPPALYHAVMMDFLSWYRHCLKRELGVAV